MIPPTPRESGNSTAGRPGDSGRDRKPEGIIAGMGGIRGIPQEGVGRSNVAMTQHGASSGAMPDDVAFHELSGEALTPWLDDLGRLRITVFREYPYLYDGSLEYERKYLQTYVNSPRSLVVLVTGADAEIVGATTCIPLRDGGPEFQEPFLRAGWDVDDVCYFGESILLPRFRGRGIGREFFDRREAHAGRHRFKWTVFCAVDRAQDHPLRPAGHRPLDEFWISRGYTNQPELNATFVWKETGEPAESPKSLTFWTRSWNR